MALTWTLAQIRAKVRKLTGRRSASQLTDDDIDDFINDYYRNKFPIEVDLDQFRSYFVQRLSATDSGEYSLDDDDAISTAALIIAPIIAIFFALGIGLICRMLHLWNIHGKHKVFYF